MPTFENHKTIIVMIDILDYSKVPAGFVHCLNGNCKQAEHCLRYQVTRYVPATRRDFRMLNPSWVIPEGDCPEFMNDTPVKYAYGWTHMFDKLIHEKAIAIKDDLSCYYGKNEFYRLKRKEKSFTPQAQQYVRSVFLRYGVKDEPIYDEYRYEYKWDKD